MSNYAPSGSSSSSKDIFVVVMGVTGSGKSTFISHCTEQHVEVGHHLHACTQEVKVYDCHRIPGRRVKLVDTPGFDDTNRSDTDVLREIASWLTASYESKIQLHGIIYLHRISDLRMPGSGKRNLHMLKKLCGPDALCHVTLATTMWENVDHREGVARENELRENPEFWGYMLSQGSRLERHTNDQDSAMSLLSMFVEASGFVVELQRQMVDQKKGLNQTDAGMELEKELNRERAKFQKEMEIIKEEMKDAIKDRDEESARELKLQRKEMGMKIRKVNEQHANLKRTLKEEHNSRYAEMKAELQAAKLDADMREKRQTQVLEDEQQARKLHEEEMQKLRQQLQNTQLQQSHIKSTPVATGTYGKFSSLSLVGEYYILIHSKGTSFSVPSSFKFPNAEYFHCMALGTNGSWYQSFKKANDERPWCQMSRNFASEYPYLAAIDTYELYSKPLCLSLGVNGNYFANFGTMIRCCFDDATKEHIGDVTKVSHMWFGMNNAYVAVLNDGSLRWDLRGGYDGLATELRERDERISVSHPQAMALDLKDNQQFLVVWDSYGYRYWLHEPLRGVFLECLWKNGYPAPK